MSVSQQARAVADAQLEAYNARNMDAYLALFHEDATLINLPGQEVIARGKAAIKEMYMARFATPGLYCEVHHRSEIGTVAIDRKTVHSEGAAPVDTLAMYQVTGGKIAGISFCAAGRSDNEL